MNRREAMAALMALPATARISRAVVKPTDVIVIESDEILSANQILNLTTTLQQVWPQQKILVLDRHLRLKIVDGSTS